MARNINNIHEDIVYIVRKERGGFVTSQEIDNMLQMGQVDYYEDMWMEYLKTGTLPDCLEVFKARSSFTYATSVGGLVTKPTDYQHFLNLYTVTYDNEREESEYNEAVPVDENQIVIARRSQLRPVSRQRPKLVQGATKFVLYPQVPQAGYFNYLRTPATPYADYTVVGREETYNPSGSTQLEWREVYLNDIIRCALSYIGVNLNEAQITAYVEQKQQSEGK